MYTVIHTQQQLVHVLAVYLTSGLIADNNIMALHVTTIVPVDVKFFTQMWYTLVKYYYKRTCKFVSIFL